MSAFEAFTYMLDLIYQAADLANHINESVSNGSFTLEVDGQTYLPDPDSLSFDDEVECGQGEQADGMGCRKFTVRIRA